MPRYGDNNALLLEELAATPLKQCTAHYVCHLVLADPQGLVRADCEAYCHGRIRFEPVCAAGFGYDPLFEVVEYHRTFGELGENVKAVLATGLAAWSCCCRNWQHCSIAETGKRPKSCKNRNRAMCAVVYVLAGDERADACRHRAPAVNNGAARCCARWTRPRLMPSGKSGARRSPIKTPAGR